MAKALTEGLPPAAKLKLGWISLRQDASWAWRHFRLNVVSGSDFMPRLGRYLLYRSNGISTRTPNIFSGCRFRGSAPVTIGESTFVNHGCSFEANAPIVIGRDCHIAMEVLFVTSDHAFEQGKGFSAQATYLGIRVGDRCWIGARATILPGVTIGDDVVVAAGAVVTKDCASSGVYAGVPARRLRDIE
jgi:acetyltransferase-like isoleucine patch superfamily enzyme